jgi:hypothetical protein
LSSTQRSFTRKTEDDGARKGEAVVYAYGSVADEEEDGEDGVSMVGCSADLDEGELPPAGL